MPLVQFLMIVIVVGVLLWLVNNFIPMQGTIKSILNAVVVIGAGLVDPQRIRAFSFLFPYSHRIVSRQERTAKATK